MGFTTIDKLVRKSSTGWADSAWYEVEDFLWRSCSRDELIWLGDTGGLAIPQRVGDRELSKPDVLLLLRDMKPKELAARYHTLLRRRRSVRP
jgi:hypothetical protein